MNYFNKRYLLTISFLFGLTLFVTAQKVTMNGNNITVKEAMSKLKSQTGYSFIFYSTDVNTQKRISLNIKDEDIQYAVKKILQGQNLVFEIQNKQIIIHKPQKDRQTGSKQNIKAKGRITDADGEPLIGATVMQNGTSNGTITDIDGYYTIEVPSGSLLSISCIGYSNKTVSASPNSNITLEEDNKIIQDVVVIGYGTARKSDLTGSVSSLSGERLSTKNSPQLSTRLQGQIAGVQVTRGNGDPATHAGIRIRGVTTMSTNDPLFIVDGIPVSTLDDVAPEDVENIQVLKDAAAAAIYGSRAAAGVILVTTKRAKDKKFNLTYNMEYGIDTPTTRPRFGNAVEWMKGFNEMKYNDGAKDLFSAYSEEFINSYNENHRNDPDNYPDTDWTRAGLSNNASHQNHSINISGGTDRLASKFSFNYYTADAIYKNKNYEKFSVRSNNDYKINDWIHANIDLNLHYIRNTTPNTMEGSVTRGITKRAPIYAAYWSDGTLADGKDGDNNIAAIELGGQNTSRYYRAGGKFQLDMTPLKGLTITAVASPSYYFYKSKRFKKAYQVRRLNGDMINGTGFGSTSLSESRNDNQTFTTQLYGNYHITLRQHNISATAGYEDYQYKIESMSGSRDDFSLTSFPYLNLGSADKQYNSGTAGHNAYRSFFGRMIYSYANRYMLQANIRTDGSSRFAKGHRWGTFPSASAGWVISEEPWFKKGTVEYIKLRASIGRLGNERIGSDFPYQSLLQFTNNLIPNASTGGVDVVSTAAQKKYAFKDITWETTTTYGVGLDLSLFNSRLRFTGDLYYKKTTDMLMAVGFPTYFGYESPANNAADMHTSGWDIELSWNDQIKDFRYGVSFNLSDYRSRMGYMADKQNINGQYITEQGSYYQEWYLYKNMGIILNEEAMYDADGKKIAVISKNDKPGCIRYQDIDGDGNITASNDRVRSGNSLPELLFGGNIWAEWRNLDFSMSFQGVGHQNSYINSLWIHPYMQQSSSLPDIIIGNHWSPTNTDEENARMKYPMIATNDANLYANSDFYLFNGAYFRVKNITLGYTLPKQISKKFLVDRLRVYFSANDLPAISKYPKGYDPEYTSGDYIMSSYVFGLNISF